MAAKRAGRAATGWNFDKIAKYQGSPKIGAFLRRDVKRLFHELFERANLLALIDQSFVEELKRLKLDQAVDVIGKMHNAERGREGGR
jgi:hypothetical protein